MDLSKLEESYKDDLKSIDNWCEELYDKEFSKYFKDVRKLKNSMENGRMSDNDLEIALTSIPLDLFEVHEKINHITAYIKFIEFNIKQKRHDAIKLSSATSKTAKQEDAEFETLEDELLKKCYLTVIERVESEVSYTREFIMGAKKVWSARREQEETEKSVEPTPNKDLELPEYGNIVNKTYVK